MSDKVVITPAMSTGKQDYLIEWFECPKCGNDNICSQFNFCPSCGVALDCSAIKDMTKKHPWAQ